MNLRNGTRSANRGQFDHRRENKQWARTDEEREKTVNHEQNKERDHDGRQQYSRYPKRQNQFKAETNVVPSTSGTGSNKTIAAMPKKLASLVNMY